jgi:hypothetical protein
MQQLAELLDSHTTGVLCNKELSRSL